MNFYFGMGGTALSPSGTRLARTEMECRPISLRQKLRMQRERMQCAVLSPGGTRLAPTEAARRPVACCFERSEQLLVTSVKNCSCLHDKGFDFNIIII